MSISENEFTNELPIFDFKSRIIDAVDNNQVTIITAETGAGKSTQVPQYLAEHGYDKVIVTQPRILAARNLSNRVREEWAKRTNTNSEPIIGYRTAHERNDLPETQILYCTDGLQLVREITGSGIRDRQVLILDEVHEWNENMEVLIAWAKKRCQKEPNFKVVIMSATIETDTLAAFFDTTAIITVPGRSFSVTKRIGRDIINELLQKLEAPIVSNILVFLPGKAEIQNVADVLAEKAAAAQVPIIPLHSQLEVAEQQRAFASYARGKIILSTNIAQTSVTINDIDVVIDSGLERRNEVRNGVEGLFIANVSQADCKQRAGRAGRTKPGEYILAPYDVLPCPPIEEREPYGTPEILRKHIDRLALRLAAVNIDIEQLEFYHDPSSRAIKRAKHTLVTLGALDRQGNITSIGRAMEQYPVESSYARMLIESKKYNAQVQSKLAACIAIQEVGGIVRGGTRYTGWRTYTSQTHSDLLAQYEVYLALPSIAESAHEELGIIGKNVDKAQEVMQRLNYDLRDIELDDTLLTPVAKDEQEAIMRCIVAGQIDELWVIDEHGRAEHIFSHVQRELSSSTVVRNPKLIAGTPFDLQVPVAGRDGELQTLHLVQGITAVRVEWLLELLPDRLNAQRSQTLYDPRLGMLVSRSRIRIGKQIIEGNSEPILENSKQNQRLFQDAFAKWIYGTLERERSVLAHNYTMRVPSISLHFIKQQVRRQAAGAIGLGQLTDGVARDLVALSKLETHVGVDFMNKLAHTYRREHSGGRHHAHRGHGKKDKRRLFKRREKHRN